jgi:hypothetical protein
MAWTLWPLGWSSFPICHGIVVGKMRGRNNVDVLQEAFMEPVGIVKLGACGARIYTQEELDRLGDLEERSERKTEPVEIRVMK